MTNKEKLRLAVASCGMRTTLEELIEMLQHHPKESYLLQLRDNLLKTLSDYETRHHQPCLNMVRYTTSGMHAESGYTACVLPRGHKEKCSY